MLYKKAVILFLFLAFCFSSQICFATPKASLVGLVEDTLDLGKVKEGEVKKGEFLIENSGDKPLVIRSVQPSCSCVKVISGQKEFILKPQEKEKIVFSFDSTGYSGKTTEYLYLETNAPSQKILRARIISDVQRSQEGLKKRFGEFSSLFIITAGLIDGINPCAFTVIVFFMSFLFFVGYSRREIFIVGLAFVLAVFLTYLLIGLGIFSSLRHFSGFLSLSRIIYYLTAALAFILGLISFIDFWRYRKNKNSDSVILKLPQFLKNKITRVINERLDRRRKGIKDIFTLIASAFSCGIIVSFLESACTGQMYLPTIVYMLKDSSLKARAFLYLLLYNFMFILPLILIFLFAGFGVSSDTFRRIAGKHIGIIKLVTALLFLALGILLLITV